MINPEHKEKKKEKALKKSLPLKQKTSTDFSAG